MKAKLRSGEQLLGVLVRMPSEELIEMAGIAGMDYVFIDCEHGPADLIALRQHITAAELHGMDVLVRVGQNEPALIQRVLDHGATGIVVPHVDDAAQARAVVQHARYAPVGDRGFATYGRAGRFGQVPAREHVQADADRTVVIVMIESRTGCTNTEEILAVPGIDGAMGGPADLALSFGVDGPSDDQVSSALETLHQKTSDVDKLRMEIVSSAAQASQSFSAGADLVVINLTHILMETLEGLTRHTECHRSVQR